VLRIKESYRYILLLVFGILFFVSCENDIKKVSLSGIEDLPEQTLKDAELIYSDSGKVQMLLKAPVIDRYGGEENYNEFPKGIKASFYDEKGQIKSSLTANYAIHFEKMKIMEAKNNVVLVNRENNEQLNTEHLVWDEKRAIIYSDKFVKITTKDEVLLGEGFESDETFTKWKIISPKGSFPLRVGNN
jgi:LPS export ABC transporter protein LptC